MCLYAHPHWNQEFHMDNIPSSWWSLLISKEFHDCYLIQCFKTDKINKKNVLTLNKTEDSFFSLRTVQIEDILKGRGLSKWFWYEILPSLYFIMHLMDFFLTELCSWLSWCLCSGRLTFYLYVKALPFPNCGNIPGIMVVTMEDIHNQTKILPPSVASIHILSRNGQELFKISIIKKPRGIVRW